MRNARLSIHCFIFFLSTPETPSCATAALRRCGIASHEHQLYDTQLHHFEEHAWLMCFTLSVHTYQHACVLNNVSRDSRYDQPVDTVSVSSLARRRNFHCVAETATLDDVAKLLVHKGCHRVPVMDATGEIVNIISQSTIIK